MSSSEALFSKCCFCFPLRIGCFCLGYLSVALNALNTVRLVAVTAFLGVLTHGFTRLDDNRDDNNDVEKPFLSILGLLLGLMVVLNAVWLAVSISCLIGVHKKKPGPIRVYVAFAVIRIFLSATGLCFYIIRHKVETASIIAQCFEISLAAYFTLVYYVYAKQLQREQDSGKQTLKQNLDNNLKQADPALVYPEKIDKQYLITA